jgi:hypothetical protein
MPKDDVPAKPAKDDQKVVHGSSYVTISFPFSNINMRQPVEEVRELAAIVVALSEELAGFRPSPATAALAERARKLTKDLEK